MTVKKAKKLLKQTTCAIRPERLLYTKVVWKHKRKVFIVESYWGQTTLVKF